MGPSSTTSSSDAPSTGVYTAITSPHAGDAYDEFPEPSTLDLIEPLAIVGFSLKFPEDATDADSFWDMLINGRNVSSEFPKDRLNIDSFNDPKNDRLGTISMRGGHFVKGDLGAFDAPFFSITPAEAAAMDPQQRTLLEVAYRALENAGSPIDALVGSDTSVHTGCFTADYANLMAKDPDQVHKYTATGTAATMLSNRINWFFDLKGTSVTLDSACSSSIVALDLACQGLWNHTTSMALVAGCNLMYAPDLSISLSNMTFLSPDSRCYSFDDRANGYSRGEGFGVVVVKRLSDALANNDTIRAIIRNTGSNQDGHTPGITQPSQDSQAALIRSTYERAGLGLEDTRFFEAHGTGTAMGDPIEAGAIGSAFQDSGPKDEPLYIGSVKANIGHLEGAAGIAGLIKTVMVLEKGIIPPIAAFKNLNPKIDADFLRLKFPSEPTPWPSTGLRRASVNSFGFGGTNSHVILDDAYNFLRSRNLVGNHRTITDTSHSDYLLNGINSRLIGTNSLTTLRPSRHDSNPVPKILLFSAPDTQALQRLTEDYTQHFQKAINTPKTQQFLDDLAYTLDTRRSSFVTNAFCVANSDEDLRSFGEKISKPVQRLQDLKLGFVFTGQGAQWHAMGRELLSVESFKANILRMEEYLTSLGCSWSLLDELMKSKDESRINEPELSQPVCTVIQITLVDLLRSFGVSPTAVVGHSSGEIAAAYSVGAISCESALRIAYFRGIFATEVANTSRSKGRMMAVGLSVAAVQPYIDTVKDLPGDLYRLTVSCINSPGGVTISGDEQYIDILLANLQADKVFARKLQVTVAYHSAQMLEVAEKYGASIGTIEPGDYVPKLSAMVSSVTGQRATHSELQQPDYWVRNMTSPVKFSPALESMCLQKPEPVTKKLDGSHRKIIMVHDLLELGPHSALQGPIREILQKVNRAEDMKYYSALVRGRSALDTTFEALGQLYCRGYPVDIAKINRPTKSISQPMLLVDLPEYPFDHSKSYWFESRLSKSFRFRKHGYNPLLGTPVSDWNPLEGKWRHFLGGSDLPWVEDHKINGAILYPAAGMCIMAIEAARQMAEDRPIKAFEIKNATFHTALTIPISGKIETQFSLRPLRDASDKDNQWSDFRVDIYQDEKWIETSRGSIQVIYETEEQVVDHGRELKQELATIQEHHQHAAAFCGEPTDSVKLYEGLHGMSYQYGPAFKPITQLQVDKHGVAIGEVALNHASIEEREDPARPCVIHPTTLDGMLQMSLAALTEGGQKVVTTRIPTRIRNLWVANSGLHASHKDTATTWTKIIPRGMRGTDADISVLDKSQKKVLLKLEGFETTTISNSDTSAQEEPESQRLCYGIHMKPDIELIAADKLTDYCDQVEVEVDPEQYFKQLHQLKLRYMSDALKELVKHPIAQDQIPTHFQKYIAWMHLQLAQGDFQDTDLNVDDIAQVDHQKALILRTGENLVPILRGEVDPLALFFKDDLMRKFYNMGHVRSTGFSKFAKYLDLLAHKNPTMKFLEVGAGTGATTEIILGNLTKGESVQYGRYDFSDISAGFFGPAQELFGEARNLNFLVLDVENDIEKQGVEVGSYDVVVAAHVLHATNSLDRTLSNIRKTLKPGGKLIMVEPTTPDRNGVGFTFGLLPGWWLGSEEYRENGPSVTVDKWDELLKVHGFSGTDIVFKDYESDVCHEWSIIIATAEDGDAAPALTTPSTVIVADGDSRYQQRLAKVLQSEGLGSNYQVLSLEKVAAIPAHELPSLVFLSELERPLLANLSEQSFGNLQQILNSAKEVLWVTEGGGTPQTANSGMSTGLARVLSTERGSLSIVTLHLESGEACLETELAEHASKIASVFRKSFHNSDHQSFESEYTEVDGLLQIPRIIEDTVLDNQVAQYCAPSQLESIEWRKAPPLKLSIGAPGLLDTLQFIEDDTYAIPMGPTEVEIQVKAVGVNFRDCLLALGRLDTGVFGCECSGIVSRVGSECTTFKPGDRVTVAYLNTYQTFVRAPQECVAPIPGFMSFVEAASVPTTFVTVYHGLVILAQLQKGESILIHAASGGTGQAAIQIAQHLGATIYVTVGTEEKKQHLKDTYGISDDQILFSRDISFAQGIKRLTKGRGVDVVLNSLSGESLAASWECVAPFGRFIEIGKKDIQSHNKISMSPFEENRTFSAIDLALMTQQRPDLVKKSFGPVMELMGQKVLRPANPLVTYGIGNVEGAMRLMQSGKNIGKIVIEVDDEAEVQALIKAKPAYEFTRDATYLITGGLGGLGRSISRWMVARGARNLLLLGRSGATSAAAKSFMQDMEALGVTVMAPKCDIANLTALKEILEDCVKIMPPLQGCIHGAMVLRDAVFQTMPYTDWTTCITPKVHGAWNLHTLLPSNLKFFISLSSVCGTIGQGGQANYAAANTYLDALTHLRISQGLAATSIDLGPMLEEGFVAENAEIMRRFESVGTLTAVSLNQMFGILDTCCNPHIQQPSQIITALKPPADLTASGIEIPTWLTRPLFTHLHTIPSLTLSPTSSTSSTHFSFATAFTSVTSLSEASAIVTSELAKRLSKILSIPVSEMDEHRPIHGFGLDSLVAVELRNWFEREVRAEVAVFEILGGGVGGSLRGLGERGAGRSGFRGAW